MGSLWASVAMFNDLDERVLIFKLTHSSTQLIFLINYKSSFILPYKYFIVSLTFLLYL